MASLPKSKNGNQIIQFTAADGKRRTLRLGKVPLKTAREIKLKVEALNAAQIAQISVEQEVAVWIREIREKSPLLYDKIAGVKLLPKREETEETSLADFIASYIANRTDVKPGTAIAYRNTERCLIEYFGGEKSMLDITPADVKDWRRWLGKPRSNEKSTENGQGLAPNTVRRRCGIARQFFNDALERRLIAENPFARMKDVSVQSNRSRDRFVTLAETELLINACPDTQFKLIIALNRYGGLRCPSEILELRWNDIHWDRERMTVRSPKTAHHGEGHGERVIPLWPEIRPYLEAAWNDAPDGTEFVITKYRRSDANLRTRLTRIIRRAGMTPWPKVFQNMRASCATDLAKSHPGYVAANWLGHSQKVAATHYWQVTDDDFKQALQKPTYQASSPSGTSVHQEINSVEISQKTNPSSKTNTHIVSPAGLEPTTYGLKVRCSTN